jgi:hypothetical protein
VRRMEPSSDEERGGGTNKGSELNRSIAHPSDFDLLVIEGPLSLVVGDLIQLCVLLDITFRWPNASAMLRR